jgi:hypothetical protein
MSNSPASGDCAAQARLHGRMRVAIRLKHSCLRTESLMQSPLLWLFLSVQRRRVCLKEGAMIITKNLGMLLLAIYLIIVGITVLVHIAIPVLVTGVLALAAGILILIGR